MRIKYAWKNVCKNTISRLSSFKKKDTFVNVDNIYVFLLSGKITFGTKMSVP